MGTSRTAASPGHPAFPGWPTVSTQLSLAHYIRVMLQKDDYTMHVQPPLPEVGIHGKNGLPVGGKLGMA